MSEQAYISLTKGLTVLDVRNYPVPSELVLAGLKDFPLAWNSQGQVLMAASLYGQGRIVALGLESYMTIFHTLLENAVTWLRGEQTTRLSVGVSAALSAVADKLQNSGFQVRVVNSFKEDPEVGVYVTDANSMDADANELVAFMKAGGGVLIAGQAWHWAKQYPNENTFLRFPGNKVSGVAGIYFTANYGEKENMPIYPKIPTFLKAVDVGMNFEKDLEFLLDGTSNFDLRVRSIPSEVLVHGPLAFSIGVTDDGRAFLAGGYYGRGRVIFMGHEAFLHHKNMSSFWNKAFEWLDQGRSGVVGVMPGTGLFPDLGLQNETTVLRRDLSVFVCKTYSAHHMKEVQEFVAEGGGLLIGGQAWGWARIHSSLNVMTDDPGNKILNRMGLSVLERTIPAGLYNAPSKVGSESLHFRRRLWRFIGHVTKGETLSSQEEAQLKRLWRDCSYYLSMEAHDSFSYTQVLYHLIDTLKMGMPQVSEETPVSSTKDKFLLSLARDVYHNIIKHEGPSPDALLPFLIKNNPTMPVVNNQQINITVATAEREEWISTGLYLSPGMKTYMIMPTNIINRKWKVLIGCQTDELHHDNLKRAPRVSEYFPVTSEALLVWNLWGGLIYLVAPPKTVVGESQVIVEKAVSAPYYKSGTTTASDWLRLRDAPAPWAELEFDNIVLTLPSRFIRDLENPDEVARLWNSITKGISELSAIPEQFPRKERIVADVQISSGWSHAGYPIMMHSSGAATLFKPNGLWGILFSLGYNQQRSYFEFPPHTSMATCNLWNVYVHEEKLGINRAQAHPKLTPQSRQNNIDKYVREGRKLSNWNVWTALETYLQLQEKFGWDTFKKVFSAYQSMSNFPKDNPGKMNLYAQTFSENAGMNLSKFFKAWGWPIGEATVGKLSHLPLWSDYPMPKDN